MFLTTINRRMRTLRDDERGIALVAVMALMALGMLLTTAILASVISGLGTTTSTRAGVQSQVSADGGLDVALAAMVSGATCTPTYTSGVAPKYTVTVSYTTDTTLTSASAWIAGCPTASAQYMKLTSVGTATAPGVAGNTSGNAKTIEAIYYRPVSQQTVTATGPAVYAYSAQDYSGAGILVSADHTNDANVMVMTGDVNCSGASSTAGDLIVNNGNLTVSGSCNIAGNVWLSGAGKGILTVGGAHSIGGSVVANGVNLSGSSSVGKGIWSTGDVSMAQSIVGGSGGGGVTVTAGDLTLVGTDNVNGGLWASGNISIANADSVALGAVGQNIALNGGNVKGQVFAKLGVTGVNWFRIDGSIVAKTVQSGVTAAGGITTYPNGTPAQPAAPAAPIAPVIPNWIEFTYNPSDWSGFTVYTVPAGTNCTETTIVNAYATFGSSKGLIDARNCTGQVNFAGTLSLLNDLAIIAPKGFNMSNGIISSSGAHNLWLISPDPSSSGDSPTSTACSPTVFSGGFAIGGNVSVMTYTPCEVQVTSSLIYRGQIFAGAMSVSGAAVITYNPVGLPGWNLNTGTQTTVSQASNNWTLQSTRNIGG